MKTASKKKLVQSIKQNGAKSNVSDKNKPANTESYESYANTAIDYSKNHYAEYEHESNQEVTGAFNADSNSPIQDENGEVSYDADIMNEIQMEIYTSNIVQPQKKVVNSQRSNILQQKKNTRQNNSEDESSLDIPKKKPQIQLTNGLLKNNSTDNNRIGQSTRINNVESVKRARFDEQKSKQKIVVESEESSLSIPKKIVRPSPMQRQSNTDSLPAKIVKRDTEPMKMKPINIKINIKLMNTKQQIKKVVNCAESGQMKDRDNAKFLVQTQAKKQIILTNPEMIYFYKDALIDYYQAIHFS